MTFRAASYEFFMIFMLLKGDRLPTLQLFTFRKRHQQLKLLKAASQQKGQWSALHRLFNFAGTPRKGLICTSGFHVTTH